MSNDNQHEAGQTGITLNANEGTIKFFTNGNEVLTLSNDGQSYVNGVLAEFDPAGHTWRAFHAWVSSLKCANCSWPIRGA